MSLGLDAPKSVAILLFTVGSAPKLVNAANAVVAPVPPLANAIVVPLHVPEVMVPTALISVPTSLLEAILPDNIALVTLLTPIVVVNTPEPEPVISPVKVIV